jgi:hypothetical protein
MTTFLPKPVDLEALDQALAGDDIPWVPQEPGRWSSRSTSSSRAAPGSTS